MKTLKTFLITVLFASISIFSNANEYNETTLDVESIKDLTVSIKKMVITDFRECNNYFYQHNIDRMKEDVIIVFYVNNKNEINLLNVNSDDDSAEDYISHLLDGKKIKSDSSALNKKYRLTIKLDYRI